MAGRRRLLVACLARLLGALAEVEPVVHEDAGEVVAGEDEEGDLGRLRLDENAEELRDEERAEPERVLEPPLEPASCPGRQTARQAENVLVF